MRLKPLLGLLIPLACAGLWATYNLASRLVVAHLPHALVNALTYGVGGMALFVLSSPSGPYGQLTSASASAVGALVVMGAVSSALAGQFFLHGVRTVGVGRSVAFVYLVPVLTAAGARATLNEPLSAAQMRIRGVVNSFDITQKWVQMPSAPETRVVPR